MRSRAIDGWVLLGRSGDSFGEGLTYYKYNPGKTARDWMIISHCRWFMIEARWWQFGPVPNVQKRERFWTWKSILQWVKTVDEQIVIESVHGE